MVLSWRILTRLTLRPLVCRPRYIVGCRTCLDTWIQCVTMLLLSQVCRSTKITVGHVFFSQSRRSKWLPAQSVLQPCSIKE